MPSSPTKVCAYVSARFKENFDPVGSGDGGESEAKVMAKQMLKREGCDLSGEPPPLKCRKASNTYIVESDTPPGVLSPVSLLLELTRKSRPASADSTDTNMTTYTNGGNPKPSLLEVVQSMQRDLAETRELAASTEARLTSTEAQLAATREEAQRTQSQLAATREEAQRTQSRLAATREEAQRTQSRLAATREEAQRTQSRLAATREEAQRTQSRLAATREEAQRTQSRLAATREEAQRTQSRLEAELASTHAELARVRDVAEGAQSSSDEQRVFSMLAAECQIRATLEEYRFCYFKCTIDAYRGGHPSTFLDTDKDWEKYMACASWQEEKEMAAKGFTRLANNMAAKGPFSYHSFLSERIHRLKKEIIPECVKLLGQEADAALAEVIAAVNAFSSL